MKNSFIKYGGNIELKILYDWIKFLEETYETCLQSLELFTRKVGNKN